MINWSKDYDNHFKVVQNLKWIPWVGLNFGKTEQLSKILIIGESHYLQRGNDISDYEASKLKHENPDFTRIIISEMQKNKYNLKVFSNLNSIFKCASNDDIYNFYSNIAFYNFIQAPVENIKVRPTDFKEDWQAFKSVIEILKPDVCIFLGTQALKTFKDHQKEIDLDFELLRFLPKIDNTYPALFSFHLGNKKINCLGIKHTSRVFQPLEWTNFIQTHLFIDLKKFHKCPNSNL